ncbi:hypothetical protein ACODNH_02175 (plasmid) [Haloarcula sp. NS06]|uniref:hypothetical protein n=1 Tax=Haloarcula sp. NS06 TaxID=3409688 RepID=UPI003DA7A5A3
MTVDFKIWKVEEGVSDGFVDGAIDAIGDLDTQIDTNLAAEAMNPSIPFQSVGTDYGDFIETDLVPHVVDNYGCPSDEECHIVITQSLALGAGGTLGTVKGSGNPFTTHPDCNSSEAAAAGVNTHSKTAGVSAYPSGDDTFEVTVMHNAIHALLGDNIDTPSDGCSQGHSKDHSLGRITPEQNVSPAQIWYTAGLETGNIAPCDNCVHNAGVGADGATKDISSCTTNQIANSADNLGY